MSRPLSHLCAFGAGVSVAAILGLLLQSPKEANVVCKCTCNNRSKPEGSNATIEEWEAGLRLKHDESLKEGKTSEPFVLDVSPANIGAFETDYCLSRILQDLVTAGLPPHWVRFVWCLLVARGVAKAFVIRTELVNYKKVILHLLQAYSSSEISLRQMCAMFYCGRNEGSKEDHIRHVTLDKALMKINGCLAILRCVRTWSKAITSVPRMLDPIPPLPVTLCTEISDANPASLLVSSSLSSSCSSLQLSSISSSSASSSSTSYPTASTTIAFIKAATTATAQKPLFRAGDNSIFVIPANMRSAIDLGVFRRLVSGHGETMRVKIQQEGWPPLSCTQGLHGTGGHKHRCRECKLDYGKAWVRDDLCWRCEDNFRAQGRCPWEKGAPLFLCPHARLCLSCEQHDCVQCGFAKGDGAVVEGLVCTFQPQLVVLDWDQTVCDTQSGTAPKIEKNSINASLLRVMLGTPRPGLVSSSQITQTEESLEKLTKEKKKQLRNQTRVQEEQVAGEEQKKRTRVSKALKETDRNSSNEELAETMREESTQEVLPQIELASRLESYSTTKENKNFVPYTVHIVTRQNPAHAQSISDFLIFYGVSCSVVPKLASDNKQHKSNGNLQDSTQNLSASSTSLAFPWLARHIYLHCLGRSRTSKATTIGRIRALYDISPSFMFVDDTAAELLGMNIDSPANSMRVLFSDNSTKFKHSKP